jgi:hypothetical protein
MFAAHLGLWERRRKNMADKIAAGTSKHGESTRDVSISVQTARQIKFRDRSIGSAEASRQFKTTASKVSNIDTGKAWVWLGKTEAEE